VLYCAARYPEQETSLRQYLDSLHKQGLTENDYRWLSPEQLAQQIRIAKPYGGIYAPHVATIHPAKLVRGLARTVERMGVRSTKTARSPIGRRVACARRKPRFAAAGWCRRWKAIRSRCRRWALPIAGTEPDRRHRTFIRGYLG
jgi:glycine/D-amino acid oxidase-like deaminating enzyme